jgi:hypothetical protein
MFNTMLIRMWAAGSASTASSPQEHQQGQVCVANIDTQGRRQRLMAGVVQLVVGLGLLGLLLALHANPLWRLPLLLVFSGAAVGFFQWRDRT